MNDASYVDFDLLNNTKPRETGAFFEYPIDSPSTAIVNRHAHLLHFRRRVSPYKLLLTENVPTAKFYIKLAGRSTIQPNVNNLCANGQ